MFEGISNRVTAWLGKVESGVVRLGRRFILRVLLGIALVSGVGTLALFFVPLPSNVILFPFLIFVWSVLIREGAKTLPDDEFEGLTV